MNKLLNRYNNTNSFKPNFYNNVWEIKILFKVICDYGQYIKLKYLIS